MDRTGQCSRGFSSISAAPRSCSWTPSIEGWKASDNAVFYRPVPPTAGEFSPSVNESIRARWEDLSNSTTASLIDFRSKAEYTGEDDKTGSDGHIPSARHLEWRSLVGEDNAYLFGLTLITLASMLRPLTSDAGDTIAYCRTGPRASLGFLALSKLGYSPRLYDGSMTDWLRRGGPVEPAGNLVRREPVQPRRVLPHYLPLRILAETRELLFHHLSGVGPGAFMVGVVVAP